MIYQFSVFFSTKTMGVMKIHFGHRVGKYDPSTELSRDFCAGIGPLQLGVVLVMYHFEWPKVIILHCIFISLDILNDGHDH